MRSRPLAAEPTQRVAMLMAELEQLERRRGPRARMDGRALNAARDPAWTADGFVSDRWLPVSPVTGRLDAFQWKVPVAELGADAPVMIEAAEPRARRIAHRSCRAKSPRRRSAMSSPENGAAPRAARPAPRVAPIIPLAQVPDDPGPEPEADTRCRAAETEPDAWDERLATNSSAFPLKLRLVRQRTGRPSGVPRVFQGLWPADLFLRIWRRGSIIRAPVKSPQ